MADELVVVWDGSVGGPNRGLLRMAAHPVQAPVSTTIPSQPKARARWLRSVILDRLERQQAVLSAKELGDEFGIDRQAVSAILRRMRIDGLISIVAMRDNAPIYRVGKQAA